MMSLRLSRARRRGAVSLGLGKPEPDFAARPQHRLPWRQQAVHIPRPGRQLRPHRGPDPAARPRRARDHGGSRRRHRAVAQRRHLVVRRDRHHRRVAARPGGALGGHRRRQRAGLAGRRPQLERGLGRRPRPPRRRLRQPRPRVRRGARHRIRHLRRAPRRRLRPLRVPRRGVRRALDAPARRSPVRFDQRDRRPPRQPGGALHRHRAPRLRQHRPGRIVGALPQPAHHRLRRHGRPPAREGPGAGHARPLHHRRRRRGPAGRLRRRRGRRGSALRAALRHDHELLEGHLVPRPGRVHGREPRRRHGRHLPSRPRLRGPPRSPSATAPARSCGSWACRRSRDCTG